MDSACERVANLLCHGGQVSSRSLAKLIEKSGLARSSVMAHLKHLESQALVSKEEILGGSVGRPKMLYKPTPKLLELLRTKSD
jgi:predicted ArsR family transcriptional regulator